MQHNFKRIMAAILSVMMIVTSLPADVFATGLAGSTETVETMEYNTVDVSAGEDVSTDDVYVEETVSDNNSDLEESDEELNEEIPDESEDYSDAADKVLVKINDKTEDTGDFFVVGGLSQDTMQGEQAYWTTDEDIVIYKKFKTSFDTDIQYAEAIFVYGTTLADMVVIPFKGVESDLEAFDYKYVIPFETVNGAIKAGKNITITLAVAYKESTFAFTMPEDCKARKYVPATVKENGILDSKERVYTDYVTTKSDNTVYAPNDYCFVLEYDTDIYSVKSVVVGDETIEPEQTEYYADEGALAAGKKSYSSLFYRVSNYAEGENTIVVTLEYKPIVDCEPFYIYSYDSVGFELTYDEDEFFKDPDVEHRYTFNDGITKFGFTLTSKDYRYAPAVDVVDGDEVIKTLEPDEVKWVGINHDKREFIYKDIAAKPLVGKTLKIREKKALTKISMDANLYALKQISLTDANGKSLSPKKNCFEIPVGKKVFFQATPADGFSISKYTFKTSAGSKEVKPNKAGKVELTVWEDSEMVIDTKSEFVIMYAIKNKVEAGQIVKNKGKVDTSVYDGTGIVAVCRGGQKDPVPVKSVTATVGKKKLAEFAKVVESNGVELDLTKAYKVNDPIKLTLKGDDFGTKEITLNVAQPITGFELKGVKSNKINQTNGTEKIYDIVTNKNADLSVLQVSDGSAYCSIDAKKKKVTIRTYREVEDKIFLPKEDIAISFWDGASKEPLWNYTVSPVEPSFGTPSLKVVEATDTYMDLVVTSPKSLKGVKNIYYWIGASAVGERKDPMTGSNNYGDWVPADEQIRFKLADVEPGGGHAQKYDISVWVCQKLGEDTRTEGPKTVFKNLSTKDPAYENKLSLDRKSFTAILSEKDLLLAKAVFSKNTTYRTLATAELRDSSGGVCGETHSAEAILYFGDKSKGQDDRAIYLKADEGLLPGKYTLYVWAKMDEYTISEPAKIPITFKAPVINFDVKVPTYNIYKAPGKAASIKITAKGTCVSKRGSFKPGNAKLAWDISAEDEALKKALSIKNGTVTVNKNYEVQDEEADNTFYVVVKATDCGAQSTTEKIGPFYVRSGYRTPDKIMIGDVAGEKGNPQGYYSTAFTGKKLVVKDINGDVINFSDISVSVSPKTGLYIDTKTQTVAVTKLGTYTITAKVNDGGKKSLSMKFKVTGAPLNPKYEGKPYKDSISIMESPLSFDEKNSAVAPFESYIYVESRMEGVDENGDALCDYKTTVKCKNAKDINYAEFAAQSGKSAPNKDVFVFVPKGTDVSVTITHKYNGKTESKTYKIKFSRGKGTVVNAKQEVPFYINDTVNPVTLTWKFENVKYDPTKAYYIMLTPSEDIFKLRGDKKEIEKKATFMGKLMMTVQKKSATVNVSEKKKDKTISVSRVLTTKEMEELNKYIYPGKYTFNICLYEAWQPEGAEEPITKVVSKAAKVTVNVRNVPVPTVSFAKTISMKKNAAEISIPMTAKNCKAYDIEVYNDMVNGNSNHIGDYFTIDDDYASDGTTLKGIKLKRTDKPLPKGKILTLWVVVDKVGLDGEYYYDTQKVTIKIK